MAWDIGCYITSHESHSNTWHINVKNHIELVYSVLVIVVLDAPSTMGDGLGIHVVLCIVAHFFLNLSELYSKPCILSIYTTRVQRASMCTAYMYCFSRVEPFEGLGRALSHVRFLLEVGWEVAWSTTSKDHQNIIIAGVFLHQIMHAPYHWEALPRTLSMV